MDLRQLRYIVAVADAGGIRKASRRLHLTQPSLSQALRQLEAELGVELIRRSARGAELTEAGAELVDYARDILDRANTAKIAMRRHAEQRSSTLRIGLLEGTIAAGELTAAHPRPVPRERAPTSRCSSRTSASSTRRRRCSPARSTWR